VKARRVKKLDPARSLSENAARIVRTRLEELRSFAPTALEPGASEAQHDMRIAAKRLRYVLEATGFCFGAPGDEARRQAKVLQELLGDLHDCDVMLPRIERHIARLRRADAAALRSRVAGDADLEPELVVTAPNLGAYRGLEALMTYLMARRDLLCDRFRGRWFEQERSGTWVRLADAAESVLAAAKASRRNGVHANFTASSHHVHS
jgi:hypothetical protein